MDGIGGNGPAAPFASVLVRTRNDGEFAERTLKAIFSQETDFTFEVVVCDDASTDSTRAVASSFPVRFMDRPAGPYKPGRTLNALVREARGEVVVFNNMDAVPCDGSWLARLVGPLRAGPGGRADVFAFANQLPRPDADPLVRKDSLRAFGDGTEQAKWRFFFSLASSATWRDILVGTPFDEDIQYSEDVEWTWRNRMRVKTAYCPLARVEHSHNYTLRQLARRFRGEGAADRAIFGDPPSLVRELAGAARETLRDWMWLARRPAWWMSVPCAPVRRLVQRISHWNGMRHA